MLELVGSVGGLLGDAKAAGESPSQFATEVMNLAVSKAWGDSAGKSPAGCCGHTEWRKKSARKVTFRMEFHKYSIPSSIVRVVYLLWLPRNSWIIVKDCHRYHRVMWCEFWDAWINLFIDQKYFDRLESKIDGYNSRNFVLQLDAVYDLVVIRNNM